MVKSVSLGHQGAMWEAEHKEPATSRGEREFPFPAIFGNTTLLFPSRKSGMEFSTLIPVPENWEWNFPLTFPFPKIGNGIFHSHSCS